MVVGALVLAGYILHGRLRPEAVGLTTELAALAVFLLGALSTSGYPQVAVPLGIIVSAVLAFKEPLHALVEKIGRDDIYAGVKLLIATFIVLPVLPDRTLDPWGALNPYRLWLLVILISGLSLVGYALTRWLGPERGLALAGVSGGLVSSTAVTLSFAKRSREETVSPASTRAILVAILLAWAVMSGRLVVIVTATNPALLQPMLVPFAAIGLVTLGTALFLHLGGAKRLGPAPQPPPAVPLKNPFSLTSAGKFALFFALVLVVVKVVESYASGRGLYLVAALAGLGDVDAIALSMAGYAKQGGAAATAVRAIVIAALSNTLVKAGMVVALGHPALRRRTLAATALILAAGIVAIIAL